MALAIAVFLHLSGSKYAHVLLLNKTNDQTFPKDQLWKNMQCYFNKKRNKDHNLKKTLEITQILNLNAHHEFPAFHIQFKKRALRMSWSDRAVLITHDDSFRVWFLPFCFDLNCRLELKIATQFKISLRLVCV